MSPPSSPGHPHVPLRAVLLVCTATVCFTTLDSLFKYLVQHIPVLMLVWVRYLVQLVAVALWLGPRAGRRLVTTRKLTAQLFRGATLTASSICFISALKVMPLAEATALSYTTPILVVVLAVVFLDETMTRLRVAFVLAGFAGMLMIIRPGSDLFQGAALLSLGSAWLYSMFQITTRKLADEDWAALMFYPAIVGSVALSCLMVYADWPASIAWHHIALAIVASLFGVCAHFLLQSALVQAPASAITPFSYVQLVWSTLVGWLVFATFPDGWALAGMTVIALSGLMIALYEHRQRANAGARLPPPPPTLE